MSTVVVGVLDVAGGPPGSGMKPGLSGGVSKELEVVCFWRVASDIFVFSQSGIVSSSIMPPSSMSS